jgi:hypothetical protein
MLFIILVKASKNSEGANLPSPVLMQAMDQYNDQLDAAGIKIMAKGLHPSREGFRLSFPKAGEKPILTNGPFDHVNELIAGFFLIEVASKEEAITWFKKAPDPQGNGEGQLELRQVY